MSKPLTHGKTTDQTSARHEKRLLAIERTLGDNPASIGVPDLRDALYATAGVQRGEQARNFDPILADTSLALGSGARRYMAVYWPGGPCTGMTMLPTVQGNYTDVTPNSGAGLFSSDGTTFTLQAVNQRKWTFAPGETRVPWTGGPFTLPAAVYYACIEYFTSAATTVPQFGARATIDPTIWGGDTNQDWTPSSWPLVAAQAGVSAQLPASILISALTIGTILTVPYVGLY